MSTIRSGAVAKELTVSLPPPITAFFNSVRFSPRPKSLVSLAP